MKKMENKKKKIFKWILIISLIFIVSTVIIFFIYSIMSNEKIKYSDKKIELNQEKKIELKEKIIKKDEIKKKYEGKQGDVNPPNIELIAVTSKIIDYKEKIFPKLILKTEDESGIFRIRLYLYYKDKLIGYLQENPNTKKVLSTHAFFLDPYVILEEYKTFKDYEGASIDYEIKVWDNNMNEGVYKSKEKIEIKDNTSPSAVRVYWTFFYNEENKDVEVYNNEIENTFVLYKSVDYPIIEDNKIKKYEYGLKTTEGALLYKNEIEPFEEVRKNLVLEIEGEGKFIFYTKAYDMSDNFSEKKIVLYLDQTPPIGKVMFEYGEIVPAGRTVNVYVSADDNLSGVTNFRIALNKADLYRAEWQKYENGKDYITTQYRTPYEQNAYMLWYQFRDDAGNVSNPEHVGFYARKDNNINITSKYEKKELEIKIDKRDYNKGKINIKSMEVK